VRSAKWCFAATILTKEGYVLQSSFHWEAENPNK